MVDILEKSGLFLRTVSKEEDINAKTSNAHYKIYRGSDLADIVLVGELQVSADDRNLVYGASIIPREVVGCSILRYSKDRAEGKAEPNGTIYPFYNPGYAHTNESVDIKSGEILSFGALSHGFTLEYNEVSTATGKKSQHLVGPKVSWLIVEPTVDGYIHL